MKLFRNNTSPYARIATIALTEKGYANVDVEVVNPWADPSSLVAVNSAARVPALQLDDGTILTESLLIVMWAERDRREPALLGADAAAVLSLTGVAMGVIDAAVHTIVGRLVTDASFDEAPVGLRRRRSMASGLARIDAGIAAVASQPINLAVISAITALDYVDFRFPEAQWMPRVPELRRLRAMHASRASIRDTVPHD